jgi:phosphoglycolate phosphatase-like HAD superfamily hydrolase
VAGAPPHRHRRRSDRQAIALEKTGTSEAVLVGDSRWDIEAICVVTGGWSEQELRDHGAVAVFGSLVGLTKHLDQTPLDGD